MLRRREGEAGKAPGEDGVGIGMRKEVGGHSRWRKEHWQWYRGEKPESFPQCISYWINHYNM